MASNETQPVTASSTWLEELKELCEVTMDGESIRRKLQGRPVPESLRGVIWQVIMRVRSKPDALASQTLSVAEQDCPLKSDCKELAGRFAPEGTEDAVAREMEEILGFYGRSKGTEYSSDLGWAELLAPFMSVPLERGDRYNCFYVMMSKYSFKDCSQASVVFDVFRLLLMYHDPELCNMLDSLRIGPQHFAQTWVRSIFAKWCNSGVALPLWDSYFMAEDQYFVFFLSLVMLVNGRDYVFQLAESPETLASELESLPSGLTKDDIGDMCELAEHFSSITPQSFRAEYSSKLFGNSSPRKKSVSDHVFAKLCLSVPVETVLRHTEGAIKFFIIDTRPYYMYDAGHLPYAWHLDASLMIDKPQMFEDEVAKLEEALVASMQHPCFISSGRTEEDAQLGMVVARFLQTHHKYVSVVKGGFSALHKLLDKQNRITTVLDGHAENRWVEPVDSEVLAAQEAAAAEAAAAKANQPSKWGAKLKGWTASLKESSTAAAAAYRRSADKLAEKSAAYKLALKEKSKDLSARWAKKDGGKALYRGNERGPGEVFSIDDDLDDDNDQHQPGKSGGADLDLAGAVAKHSTDGDLLVYIDRVSKQSAVKYVFKCSEVSAEGYLFPSHLVLTTTHILKLRDRNTKLAAVLARRPLLQIAKITAKKKHPNLLTLIFESDLSAAEDTSAEPTDTPIMNDERSSQRAPAVSPAPQFSIGGDEDEIEESNSSAQESPTASPITSTPVPAIHAFKDSTSPNTPHGDVATPAVPAISSLESIDSPTTLANASSLTIASKISESIDTPKESNENPQVDNKSKLFVEVREMFMVPEVQHAKQAFRDSILHLASNRV